jgi:ribose-phosphate pyrophosphokinase
MTTLSYLSPSMRRLFTRVDAADATAQELKLAFHFWRDRRDGRLMPSKTDFVRLPDSFSKDCFIAEPISHKPRDWNLNRIGSSARSSLEGEVLQVDLSKLKDPRVAVRLRRLFEMVTETGEPLSAVFGLRNKNNAREIEIFAAPVSNNDPSVIQIFGAIVSRPRLGGPTKSC